MLTIQKLQAMGFFQHLADILKDKEKFEIEEILLPRPMITERSEELQLVIKTTKKAGLAQLAEFNQKLSKIFSEKRIISLFDVENLETAIKNNIGMKEVYQNFLYSAIPLIKVKEQPSLEEQWRIQENRAAAALSSGLLMLNTHNNLTTPSSVKAQDEVTKNFLSKK